MSFHVLHSPEVLVLIVRYLQIPDIAIFARAGWRAYHASQVAEVTGAGGAGGGRRRAGGRSGRREEEGR